MLSLVVIRRWRAPVSHQGTMLDAAALSDAHICAIPMQPHASFSSQVFGICPGSLTTLSLIPNYPIFAEACGFATQGACPRRAGGLPHILARAEPHERAAGGGHGGQVVGAAARRAGHHGAGRCGPGRPKGVASRRLHALRPDAEGAPGLQPSACCEQQGAGCSEQAFTSWGLLPECQHCAGLHRPVACGCLMRPPWFSWAVFRSCLQSTRVSYRLSRASAAGLSSHCSFYVLLGVCYTSHRGSWLATIPKTLTPFQNPTAL